MSQAKCGHVNHVVPSMPRSTRQESVGFEAALKLQYRATQMQ